MHLLGRRLFYTFIICISIFFNTDHANGQILSLKINGIQAVSDTTGNKQNWFASIAPSQDTNLSVVLGISSREGTYSFKNFIFDGHSIEYGQAISINNLSKKHTLQFTCSTTGGNATDSTISWGIYLTSLPLLTLDIDPEKPISKFVSAPAVFSIIDPQKRTDNAVTFTSNCFTHWRGATSSGFDKKNYAIELVDSNGEELEKNIMGIRSHDKWHLHALAIDYSRMRNQVCFDIWNEIDELCSKDMIRNGTTGYYAELILNGKYNGIYFLSDKINRKLLGIKKLKEESDGQLTLRGVLYKSSSPTANSARLLPDDNSTPTNANDWLGYMLEYPDNYNEAKKWKPLADLMDFAGMVRSDTDYVADHLYDYFYEDNIITYPLFTLAFMLKDNCMHNTFLSNPNVQKDQRIWITPWDMDGSFGRDGTGTDLFHLAADYRWAWWGTEPITTLFVYKKGDYFSRMREKWMALRDTTFSVENVKKHINLYVNQLTQSGVWAREYERWNGNPITLDADLTTETNKMISWYETNFKAMDRLLEVGSDGIVPIQAKQTKESTLYSMDGQQLPHSSNQPARHGIYIVDGKKVYIRK